MVAGAVQHGSVQMKAIVLTGFVLTVLSTLVVGCNANGSCERRDEGSCRDTTKSICGEQKDAFFINNARCSNMGYSCRDNEGTWWKPGHGNCR